MPTLTAFEIEILIAAGLMAAIESSPEMGRAAADWAAGDLGIKDLLCLAERLGFTVAPSWPSAE
ncbi:MAG: hypothetical protein ACO3JT_09475 [Candidatus Nanopelagicales bacterium]